MLSTQTLHDTLLKEQIIKEPELKLLEENAAKEHVPLEQYLFQKNIITEDVLYAAVAKMSIMPFVDLRKEKIPEKTLLAISEQFAHAHQCIVWKDDGTTVTVALTNPQDMGTIDLIEKKTGRTVDVTITTPSTIHETLKQYHRNLNEEITKLQSDKQTEGAEGELHAATDLPTAKIIDSIIRAAISEEASDIHIEPRETDIIIRFRIDGVLHQRMTLQKSMHQGIIARIKILTNLKIDEHRLPQDGRFKAVQEKERVSFRVSIIPTYDGEKVVMRLLRESARPRSLDELGFQPKPLTIVQQSITRPHGMILVTGPTGSGKTTTLYTILNIKNTPDINIVTVEDPIEYRLPGVNQSQISPRIGFTFANALRSFLRQDPDVIMVGEIRDKETAEISIHAALTGHLVLSTLHTNDAVTALPRLLDMDIAPFLIAATTNVIIAQRLVRTLCKHCMESYVLDDRMRRELEKVANMDDLINALRREGALTKKQDLTDMRFYRGKGCSRCNNEGYKGRIGIYEVLEITKDISELILKHAGNVEFHKAAHAQGMLTIFQDGIIKAKNGITSIEEIIRVTKE